ncbi:ABC transporter substrate-binding protein [Microbacterium marinilacus]|uniref:ABC transporter substrate-binding protein n=1 Tax=Microbacterium marinilacus TaxID=415209 RepID=A0ABP7BUI3_9MICO|nr:ABC transporter substrate-binding protein [Microbacterium marinilacus]MBY0688153.1 ABC transporter substrate-binding protein [Microbacterium marinilacus]
MTRTRTALALAAASVLLLTGCAAGADPDAGGEAAAGEEPRSGGVLQIAMSADYSCLDGQQARGGELNIASQILDGLTAQDPETGEIVPHLAESWDISDDASEFTFHLRDGVTFHDGTPFTAQSVKANLEGIANLGARSSLGQTYVDGLKEIEAVDDHTVRIAFEGPNAQFLQATSTTTLGFYADATLALSAEERCQGDVIGTGPFAFEAYTGNTTVELVRNDDYDWAPEQITAHQGPAYLEGLTFVVMPEASVRNGSLQSGQIDVNSGVSVQDRATLDAQGFPVHTYSNPGAPTNLWINVTQEPLDDVRVRQAITHALDREELASVVFEEQEPATNTVSSSTPGYQSQEDLLAYDPELAGELLDEAGWELGADGVREKDGQPLKVRITDYYKYNYTELIQAHLARVGIDAEIQTVTFSERSAILENGEYQIITGNLTRADADIIRTIHSIDQQNTNQREDSVPLDQELADTLAVVDETARAELLTGDVSRALLEEGYAIPMVETLAVIGTGKDVEGFAFDATARQKYYDTWLTE